MAKRHDQWAHLHVPGDRGAAAPFVPEATKLLGMVTEDAAYLGLQTHQMTRKYEDGSVVTAEIRGGIPRMTILTAGGAIDPLTPKIKENFVIRMRSQSAPDGIDPDVPETMERVEGAAWRTLFHTNATPGFSGFPGKKGTYKSNNGKVVFPDGVNHAGNVDWVSKDGLRISWYGPSTRYFFDPYVKPRSQYGKFVFMLGQVLLDVDQYVIDSDPDAPFEARWVMGAALNGNTELIVVHAVMVEPVTLTGTAPPGDWHLDMPWPVEDTAIEVCKYALAPDDTNGAPYLRVLPHSREVLATASIRNAVNPWFFNQSANEAVSFTMPDNVRAISDGAGDLVAPAPSTSSMAAVLTINGGTATIATVALSMGADSVGTIAADYRGDQRVDLLGKRYVSADGFDNRALQLGELEVRLRDTYDFRDIAGRPGSTFDRRHLVWADLREGAMLFHSMRRWMRLNAPSPTLYHRIEVYRNQELSYSYGFTLRTEFDAEFSGLRRAASNYSSAFEDRDNNPMRASNMSPMQVMYEIQDWDGVAYRQYWQGGHGLFLNLAYPASEYFGSFVETRSAGTNAYLELATVAAADASYNYEQKDVHDHYSVMGCASYDGTTLVSGWKANLGGYVSDEHAVKFFTPEHSGFPTLGGGKYRFHPVWLLGTLPKT